jgi:hypothetical protein
MSARDAFQEQQDVAVERLPKEIRAAELIDFQVAQAP